LDRNFIENFQTFTAVFFIAGRAIHVLTVPSAQLLLYKKSNHRRINKGNSWAKSKFGQEPGVPGLGMRAHPRDGHAGTARIPAPEAIPPRACAPHSRTANMFSNKHEYAMRLPNSGTTTPFFFDLSPLPLGPFLVHSSLL
jgi:hypothetical protein